MTPRGTAVECASNEFHPQIALVSPILKHIPTVLPIRVLRSRRVLFQNGLRFLTPIWSHLNMDSFEKILAASQKTNFDFEHRYDTFKITQFFDTTEERREC